MNKKDIVFPVDGELLMILPRAAATIRNSDVQLPIFQLDADGYFLEMRVQADPKDKSEVALTRRVRLEDLSQEQWEEMKAQLEAQTPMSIEEMQELGMFELFVPNPKHKQKAIELIRWLDGYIDKRLISKYRDAASAGDSRAAWGLEMFKRRCQQ